MQQQRKPRELSLKKELETESGMKIKTAGCDARCLVLLTEVGDG